MAREITLSRDEAEALTDLLMFTNDYRCADVSAQIREAFGMCPEDEELKYRQTMGIPMKDIIEIRGRWERAFGQQAQSFAKGPPEDLSDKGYFLAYDVPRLFNALGELHLKHQKINSVAVDNHINSSA